MATRQHPDRSTEPEPPRLGERELIVVATPSAQLRARAQGIASAAGADVDSLSTLLGSAGARMRPLFGVTEERLRSATAGLEAAGATDVPNLSVYYRVEAPDARLDELAGQLRQQPVVQAAYIKPPAEPAGVRDQPPADPNEPPAVTPDFSSRQGYLDAAPGGIDARHAWTRPGGDGAGVGIIDIEGEWRFSHEDLAQNQGGMVDGTAANNLGWRNHGTAVVGEFGGDRNGLGVTGICPQANVRAISIFGALGSSGAIRRAADMLNPGDVILLELHRPGPRFDFQNRNDQQGYIAIEWWPDDFDAIRYAIARGVIVVEAAGNGAQNLDDPLYDTPAQGFPGSWANPFRRGARDSGAILVGAGAPPPGTHGRNHGADRSRLDFSNFGSAVDAQGWGREVTTTGYGDLQGGGNEDLWYTDQFSGTSSASPIVVGAVGCVQGVLRAGGKAPLTPAAMRNLLRSTGSPQQDGFSGPASQRIGNRPDLRQMLDSLSTTPATRLALYRYWNASAGDHFYTTDWNELGSGRHGWQYEGVQGYVYPRGTGAGTVPLYRYWNPSAADHFYTTNWNELGSGRYGWQFESVQCHVLPSSAPGSVALHRYWNASAGDHFYTTDWNELGSGRYGWQYEGVQCHVFPTAAGGSPQAEETTEAGADAGNEAGDSIGKTPEAVPASFKTASNAAQIPATFDVGAHGGAQQPPSSFSMSSLGGGDTPGASFTVAAPEGTGSQAGGAAIQVTVRIER